LGELLRRKYSQWLAIAALFVSNFMPNQSASTGVAVLRVSLVRVNRRRVESGALRLWLYGTSDLQVVVWSKLNL
jgi:hypothetical protein